MSPTIGQHMSRSDRQKITADAAERNYGGGKLFAPITFKADDDPDFMKPIAFEGFANTGHPDLGRDIVLPEAFSKQTIGEFLKYGRQLMFMHSFYEQVGEITGAEVVKTGKRSIVGNNAGGLKVSGFVDSPFDEVGMIPDHPLAKIIHYARMQVAKGRLKAMSIGWIPLETDRKEFKDPRTGKMETYRIIEKLILREVSLVTFAMNPQSMLSLQKSFEEAYGKDVADALFCTDAGQCEMIPEKLDDFTFDRVRRLVVESAQKAATMVHLKGDGIEDEPKENHGGDPRRLKLVSLEDTEQKFRIVSL